MGQDSTPCTDLADGGLEIPWRLIFHGEARLINKVEKLLQEALNLAFSQHVTQSLIQTKRVHPRISSEGIKKHGYN